MARRTKRQLGLLLVFGLWVSVGLVGRGLDLPYSWPPRQLPERLVDTRQAVIETRRQAVERYQTTGQREYEYEAGNMPVQGKDASL